MKSIIHQIGICLVKLCPAFVLLTPIGCPPSYPQYSTPPDKHLSPQVAHSRPIGAPTSEQNIRLTISLPLRNAPGLNALLKELYDPNSPRFHHFLTAEEFASQFAPTEQDFEAVTSFLRSNRLTITTSAADRSLLTASGRIADVEKALNTTIRLYRSENGERVFLAPDREPSYPTNLPILRIRGLDNLTRPRRRPPPSQLPFPFPSPNPNASYTGPFHASDLRAAYLPSVSLTGKGQVVGVYSPDFAFDVGDIQAYEDDAGIKTYVPIATEVVTPFEGVPGCWGGGEVTLDVEMAIAMAPGLMKVIVYEGDELAALKRMASDNSAKQLSSSWVPPPQGDDADQVYKQFAAQGQTFFAASADDGAYYPSVPQWADDPNITIVGGTVLTTAHQGGPWSSETAWSASGGGISAAYLGNYSIPSWQNNIANANNMASTSMRNVPDVAMIAENVYYYWQGSAQSAGGTSFAAPLWAGFTALINQNAADVGAMPVGFLNPSLYASAASGNILHDITDGNNVTPWNMQPGHDQQYFAAVGYDLVTGWGSPKGMASINALTPPRFNCKGLAELIVSLRKQRDTAEQRLNSPLCAGPAKFGCAKALQQLNAEISSETKVAFQFHCIIPPE